MQTISILKDALKEIGEDSFAGMNWKERTTEAVHVCIIEIGL